MNTMADAAKNKRVWDSLFQMGNYTIVFTKHNIRSICRKPNQHVKGNRILLKNTTDSLKKLFGTSTSCLYKFIYKLQFTFWLSLQY